MKSLKCRASCPLRSSGVVSLLEVEVSDALIGVGQKSPFCDMLVLSPYIRACAPLRGLEGVPGLPGAPQDEAGLTRKLEM